MTGGIFTAARNQVRIIDFNPFPARFDHYIEIIQIPVRFNGLGRIGAESVLCRFPLGWSNHIPTSRTGNMAYLTGKDRYLPYGTWGPGYRFTTWRYMGTFD